MTNRWTTWRDGPVGISIALLGSVVAIALSGVGLYLQGRAVDAQEKALQEAVRQFELAGENLRVDPAVELYDQANSSWNQEDRSGTLLTFEEFSAQEVYLELTITNLGRSDGAIDSAGVMVGEGRYEPSGRVLCNSTDGDTQMDACLFPMRIEPQARVTVYVRLDSFQESMTCNPYVESHGVITAVRQVSGTTVSGRTNARVPFANDCPDESIPNPVD